MVNPIYNKETRGSQLASIDGMNLERQPIQVGS